MDLIRLLTRGFKAVVSHYMSIKSRIVLEVLNNKPVDPIIILDQNSILSRIIGLEESSIPGIHINQLVEARKGLLIVFEPGEEIEFDPLVKNYGNILVFTTPGSKARIPRFFAKIYIDKIDEDTYLMRMWRGRTVRIHVGIDRLRIASKPEGVYGQVYDLLRKLMIEYGEITIKDAIRAVSLELGVEKKVARQIIYKLLKERYFRVVHGKITLY